MPSSSISRRRGALRCAAFATALLFAGPASAGDPPPAGAPDPLEADVDAIRRFVVSGQWKAGKTAIDKFFAAHPAEPRVLAYLPSVEADLKRCLFRLAGPQPTPVELLGRGATKYDPVGSRVTFAVKSLTEAYGWTRFDEIVWFDAMFDGEMEVELSASSAKTGVVILCFDSETRGGYLFRHTYPCWSVFRFDPGSLQLRLDKEELVSFFTNDEHRVRYSLSKANVRIDLPDGRADRKRSLSVPDARYRRGFVALGGTAATDRTLTISGKLDPVFARRQIASAESRRFREWQEQNWRRERFLPANILTLEGGGDSWAVAAPAGWPERHASVLEALHRAAFEGGPRDSVTPAAGLTGVALDWQTALLAYVERRAADAEAAAGRVVEVAPEFAAAPVLLGRCLLQRGASTEALALFDEARRRDASCAPAYDGIAIAALRDGDPVRMHAALSAGAAARTSTALTDFLRQAALRLRRGPEWKKKFESFSQNYVVSSDVSSGVCNDIAKVLEESAVIYQSQFRKRPTATRARVRVFADFEGYADYVSELGANPENTLGMYLGSIRELCVWLHEDRVELSNTIRHEAFHQYLDDFLDGAPIWFNEGYAEFFGFSRRVAGKARIGQVGDDQRKLAASLKPKFKPLPELFLMEPRAFMADATVHYVQSWAVIQCMRSSESGKTLLDRYVDSLLAGRSQRQAYDEVLAPNLGSIQKEFAAYAKTLW